jgi:2-iminobutanoate/2-iminopropanoate deaminase
MKKTVTSSKVFKYSLPFAPATIAGDFLFVCCVGLDISGKYAIGDPRKQTQQVYLPTFFTLWNCL